MNGKYFWYYLVQYALSQNIYNIVFHFVNSFTKSTFWTVNPDRQWLNIHKHKELNGNGFASSPFWNIKTIVAPRHRDERVCLPNYRKHGAVQQRSIFLIIHPDVECCFIRLVLCSHVWVNSFSEISFFFNATSKFGQVYILGAPQVHCKKWYDQ